MADDSGEPTNDTVHVDDTLLANRGGDGKWWIDDRSIDQRLLVVEPSIYDGIGECRDVPVRIVTIRDDVVIARPALEVLTDVEVGDDVEFTVRRRGTDGVFGTVEGRPTFAPDVDLDSGSVLGIGVTDVYNDCIRGTVASHSKEGWPNAGDVLAVDVDRVEGSRGYGCVDGVPFWIGDCESGIESIDTFEAVVRSVDDTHVEVSIKDLDEAHRPRVGDETNATVHISDSTASVCTVRGFPLIVPAKVPTTADKIPVTITDVCDSHFRGRLDVTSAKIDLSTGQIVQIEITDTLGEDGVGFVDGIPILVPSAHLYVGEQLSLGVEESTPGHLRASIPQTTDLRNWSIGTEIELSNLTKTDRRSLSGIDDPVWVHEGVPFRVPLDPSVPKGDVRVGITQIRDQYIEASIPGIPETSRPCRGDTLVLPSDSLEGRQDRYCLYDSLPIELPTSQWPEARIKVGVSSITPGCLQVGVNALPQGCRPEDEVSIPADQWQGDDRYAVVDSVPAKLPNVPWSIGGDACLGVVAVHADGLELSVEALPDESLPDVGDWVKTTCDESTSTGVGGRTRTHGIPLFCPRTNVREQDDFRAIIVDHTDRYLVGIAVVDRGDTDSATVFVTEEIAEYYRLLKQGRDRWQDGDYEMAAQAFSEAEDILQPRPGAAEVLRMEARRHRIFATTEHLGEVDGNRTAADEIDRMTLETTDPEVELPSVIRDEFDIYRLCLEGTRDGPVMNVGYLAQIVRDLERIVDQNDSPWSTVVPHPFVASRLASAAAEYDVPVAERAERLIDKTLDRWPFLTVTEARSAGGDDGP